MDHSKYGRRSSEEQEQSFDWVKFERLMDELLPSVVPGMKNAPISRIGHFVREMMDGSGSRPGAAQKAEWEEAGGQAARLRADVTETARFVHVRIRVPEHVNPRKLQLFVGGRTLRIDGPLGSRQLVELPAEVSGKSGQAAFRDDTVVIRLRKRSEAPYKELFIRFP